PARLGTTGGHGCEATRLRRSSAEGTRSPARDGAVHEQSACVVRTGRDLQVLAVGRSVVERIQETPALDTAVDPDGAAVEVPRADLDEATFGRQGRTVVRQPPTREGGIR